ncbi:hypothetical protein EJ04DRAFT_600351 [Polyplosphaeria fusca]|uniref:Heterokaryon incompatibility domain-containing protein n=1 Tax=Polyplosphaeria fusca TaxID=682080 RepID=A0A9P4RBP9_9PLEO|nr:hypothetical protein EJ04DRAFT_600351 [Polyplosphaeria fusca]
MTTSKSASQSYLKLEDLNILRFFARGSASAMTTHVAKKQSQYCRLGSSMLGNQIIRELIQIPCAFLVIFQISDLPQTFQDAITVTRELGEQYLWIDSVCIIQHEDDYCDLNKEAKLMDEVYSSAHCTIAATSATDSRAGFLTRNESTDSPRKEYGTLDPHFPKRLVQADAEAVEDLSRIANELDCLSEYGLFKRYSHRNLLWKASNGAMEQIEYTTSVASGSWMAYNGGIEFIVKGIEFGGLREGTIRVEEYAVVDSGNEERGWLQYDVKVKNEESRDLCEKRCIIVVQHSADYLMLVVEPKT